MNIIAAPDRSPVTSSRSASARNLVGGSWVEGRGNTSRDICNPADTADLLTAVCEAAPEQVDEACTAAARAFPGWRGTPAPDRAHVLFKFWNLLEKNFSDVTHGIVRENGELLSEARDALRCDRAAWRKEPGFASTAVPKPNPTGRAAASSG